MRYVLTHTMECFIVLFLVVLLLYFFLKTQKLKEENIQLKTEKEAEKKAAKEQRILITDTQERLSVAFKSLSSDVLEKSTTSFLQLAQETLEKIQERARGDLEKRHQSIEGILNPVRESLGKLDSGMRAIERERKGEHEALKQQIKMMVDAERELRGETSALIKTLRVPLVRGRWGEMRLRRVVELADMVNYCDFYEQETHQGVRPDLVVRMPGGKQIIIDAKTPCEALLEAIQSQDVDVQREKLKAHARHVRDHVMALGKKAYWQHFQPTPEFVVLFIPSDNFFSLALEFDPKIIEVGVEQGVVIATPTTLIGLLHTIAYGWRQENFSQCMEEVSKLGHKAYKRIADMGEHWGNMGKALSRCVEFYNKAVGSLESRVLVSLRKFKEMGAASRSFEIENLEKIDRIPRTLQAPEMKVGKGSKNAPCI